MTIKVIFTTQLRSALGRNDQSISIAEGESVGGVLRHLSDLYPETFARLVHTATGELLPNLIICVDDQQIRDLEATYLRSGQTVTLLSAISGG